MEGVVRGTSDKATIQDNGWNGKGMEITNHFQPKVVCDLSQVRVGIGDKPRKFVLR